MNRKCGPSSAAPFYFIKQVDEVTSFGRKPYCWIHSNQVIGLMSGYKPVVVNSEAGPVVLAITNMVAGVQKGAGLIALKSLPEAEKLAVLDQLKRSKCVGSSGGVETEIVKAEGLCAIVVSLVPQATVGQQGVIAKAVYEWDDKNWTGVATRASSALQANLKSMAGGLKMSIWRGWWWCPPRARASALACTLTRAFRRQP